jgi:hypothetical protein
MLCTSFAHAHHIKCVVYRTLCAHMEVAPCLGWFWMHSSDICLTMMRHEGMCRIVAVKCQLDVRIRDSLGAVFCRISALYCCTHSKCGMSSKVQHSVVMQFWMPLCVVGARVLVYVLVSKCIRLLQKGPRESVGCFPCFMLRVTNCERQAVDHLPCLAYHVLKLQCVGRGGCRLSCSRVCSTVTIMEQFVNSLMIQPARLPNLSACDETALLAKRFFLLLMVDWHCNVPRLLTRYVSIVLC